MVNDYRLDLTVEPVSGQHGLERNVYDLDLDGNLSEFLTERIDLDESRIDGTRELPERGNESDASLLDLLVRVWAAEATRDRPKGSCDTSL